MRENMFENENENEDEEIILIEDYDSMHKKIRQISYWHFMFTNNNKKLPNIEEDKFKVTKKFKDELDFLLPEKESELIFKGYIKESYIGRFIKLEDFSKLIKDLSVRVCSNVLQELSKKDIVTVIWDESVENFSFQIAPEHLSSDVKSPKQFLKHVYCLAKKHLKLKDHSELIRKKK
jgi:hypothetical protein